MDVLTTAALSLSAILAGYLLGSFPSAYLVGRALKGIDITEVGDGRIGMANTYRRVGLGGAIIVGVLDVGKGAASILVAAAMHLPAPVMPLVGLAVVSGHNWSLFMGFKGGKGALAMYGVLFALMFWEIIAAAALGGVFYYFVRKSGLATGVILGLCALFHLLTGGMLIISVTPFILTIPMILKNIAMREAIPAHANGKPTDDHNT